MTTVIAAVAAMLILVLAPSPASAKLFVTNQVTITGPGTDPITVDYDDWRLLRTGALTTESRLDNAIFSYGKRDERPPGELGQVYTLRYEMSSVTTGETSFVSQDLYPFAESGPVTYLPRQSVQIDEVELQMASGWTPVPARAVERLHALGLPQDTSRFDPLGRTGLLPWAWLLASGSLGLLIVNRFRRTARMHSARPTV